MKAENITRLFSMTEMKTKIIEVASMLVTDDLYSREEAVNDLLKVADELTSEEKAMFAKLRNEKSPSHPDQG